MKTNILLRVFVLTALAITGCCCAVRAQDAARLFGKRGAKAQTVPGKAEWEATGTLFEACSCIVPCPCNFGQAPLAAANSKRDYCHTVYAYRLETARFGAVRLDGLIFGGGEASDGAMGFLDDRANPAQKAALEKLAWAVFAKGGASGGPRRFVTTTITAAETLEKFSIAFAGSGGFSANILTGADGKSPIIVENNVTWPVKRFVKGKTTTFDYHDALGNRLKLDGVNANLGAFSLSGSAAGRGRGAAKNSSCCAKRNG